MYKLLIKKRGQYNSNNIRLNNFLMKILHDQLHLSRLKHKEDESKWLNIAILPTLYVSSDYEVGFYSEKKEDLLLFANKIMNEYNLLSSFTDVLLTEVMEVTNKVSEYVVVKKENVAMNSYNFSKVKKIVEFVKNNMDTEYQIGSKNFKTKKLILNELKVLNINLDKFDIADTFIKKVQDVISKKDIDLVEQYFFKVDSSSTNTKDVVFKFRIDVVDKKDIAANYVNMVNSYGMSTKEYQFIIPID